MLVITEHRGRFYVQTAQTHVFSTFFNVQHIEPSPVFTGIGDSFTFESIQDKKSSTTTIKLGAVQRVTKEEHMFFDKSARGQGKENAAAFGFFGKFSLFNRDTTTTIGNDNWAIGIRTVSDLGSLSGGTGNYFSDLGMAIGCEGKVSIFGERKGIFIKTPDGTGELGLEAHLGGIGGKATANGYTAIKGIGFGSYWRVTPNQPWR